MYWTLKRVYLLSILLFCPFIFYEIYVGSFYLPFIVIDVIFLFLVIVSVWIMGKRLSLAISILSAILAGYLGWVFNNFLYPFIESQMYGFSLDFALELWSFSIVPFEPISVYHLIVLELSAILSSYGRSRARLEEEWRKRKAR
jgi:hypothetical protein